MASTAKTHAPLGAVTILHIVDAFYRTFQDAVRWNVSRKTRKELSRLSDAQLSDVGLTREDIANF